MNKGKWDTNTYIVIKKSNYCGINYCKIHDGKLPLGLIGKIKANYSCSSSSTTAIYNNPCGNWIIEKNLCEWFKTKEEAEQYSKQLLNPIKTVDDLISGEIYYNKINDFSWICKFKKIDPKNKDYLFTKASIAIDSNTFYSLTSSIYYWGSVKTFLSNIRIATKKEKLWLEACLEANKFISKDKITEILKDKIPIDKLIQREIYYQKFKENSYIARFNYIDDNNNIYNSSHININTTSFFNHKEKDTGYSNYIGLIILRKATEEEAQWLIDCEKQGCFVKWFDENKLTKENANFSQNKDSNNLSIEITEFDCGSIIKRFEKDLEKFKLSSININLTKKSSRKIPKKLFNPIVKLDI